MSSDTGVFALLVIVMLGFCGGFVALGMWAESKSCHSKWAASGFQTQWSVMTGCLITRDGKTYIPEDNYREFGNDK
jgi:hypothetical protein